MKFLKPKILSVLTGLIIIIMAQTVYSQSIRIITPNGGENWGQNYTEYITWESTNIPSTGTLRLYLLKDGIILGTIADGLTMERSFFKWTVGSYQGGIAPPGSGYQIYITTSDLKSYVQDTSDGPFTIQAPSIRIRFTKGGDIFTKGSNEIVSWELHNISPTVKMRLDLLNDGKILGIIRDNIGVPGPYGVGIHNWIVGSYQGGTVSPGKGYTIRISTTSGSYLQDTTVPFTIIEPLQKKVFIHPSSLAHLNELCKIVNCGVVTDITMGDLPPAKARQYLAIRQEAIQLNNKSKNATPAEKEKIEKRAQELLQQLKKLESSK